jgi:hypothetical protein
MRAKPHLLQGAPGRPADTTRPAVEPASATFQYAASAASQPAGEIIPWQGMVSPASSAQEKSP